MGTLHYLPTAQHSGMEQQVTPLPSWANPINQFLDNLATAQAPKPTVTLRSYYLRRFAVDHGGNPWEVTTADLRAYILSRPWTPATVKSFRSTMREFYRWALLEELTDRDPAALLPRTRVPMGGPRPASDESLNAAMERADERVRLMLRLAAQAGLRCREIARVRCEDVFSDLTGWSLRVDGKGGRERLVPIPDDLARDILARSPGYTFPGHEDGHLSAAYVSKLISRVMPGATAHQLRHRYATRAYQLGGQDIRAVQELLGHASVATTQIYTAVGVDKLRSVALAAA